MTLIKRMLLVQLNEDDPITRTRSIEKAFKFWDAGYSVEFEDNGEPVFGSGVWPIERQHKGIASE